MKQRLHRQSVLPFSFVRGQDLTLWDIVWVSPQGHRSVSVSRHFLLQAPQCPCSVRKQFRRDHCCRGRSKPRCRIVGPHTRWELTTWADLQSCLYQVLMSVGFKSSYSGFLDVNRRNCGLRISGWIGQLSCLTIFSTSLSDIPPAMCQRHTYPPHWCLCIYMQQIRYIHMICLLFHYFSSLYTLLINSAVSMSLAFMVMTVILVTVASLLFRCCRKSPTVNVGISLVSVGISKAWTGKYSVLKSLSLICFSNCHIWLCLPLLKRVWSGWLSVLRWAVVRR